MCQQDGAGVSRYCLDIILVIFGRVFLGTINI